MQLSWPPRVDGKFITDNPYKLVQQGKVADIPFVTGKNQPSSLSSFSLTHTKKAHAMTKEPFSLSETQI